MIADDLEGFQRTVTRVLLALAAAHVPIVAAIAALRGQNVIALALIAAAFAAVPALMYRAGRPLETVGGMLGVALVAQTSLAVYVMRGHAWQVETHFYYFAVLALLLGFCSWRILVFTAGLILVHHLTLDTFLPAAIYPGGTDIGRALVHGGVVIVETAMLVAIGTALREAFARADAARRRAEVAGDDLRRAGEARETVMTARAETAERTRSLLDSFDAAMAASIGTLHEASAALEADTDRLNQLATAASVQVITISAASEETANRVGLAAHSGEELAATIDQVGASAEHSSQLALAAVARADNATQTMGELASVAAEIGAVTALISGIAAQTNLLALNATIEAARAGEAGRGFSVVAQEVKALAAQTARATSDIAARVDALQAAAGRSVTAIEEISASIRDLKDVAANIAQAVTEQGMAARDIAGNVASAATGVGHVRNSMAEIERVLASNAEAVGTISRAAGDVAEQTGTIRARVLGFAGDIQRLRA
ncbi:MAG: methyl-accepting chemotaxis protein [Pseudolabrys sp.]